SPFARESARNRRRQTRAGSASRTPKNARDRHSSMDRRLHGTLKPTPIVVAPDRLWCRRRRRAACPSETGGAEHFSAGPPTTAPLRREATRVARRRAGQRSAAGNELPHGSNGGSGR